MDNMELYPHYLTQLRESGVFTEGDLLELEDHFFSVYEAELSDGKTPPVAMQLAEQALGDHELIISAFAKKRRWPWVKDLVSFFVFGLVVNLLGLWCLGIGFGNVLATIVYATNLDNLAHLLMPGMMVSFILFVAAWQWRFIQEVSIWQTKLPNLAARIKLKYIILLVLAPLALSLLTDPIVRLGILHRNIVPWDTKWYSTNSMLWYNYYNFSMTALTAFFGWKAYQKYLKKERADMLWSLRLFAFFMAGLSIPFVSIIDSSILDSLRFKDSETLMKCFLIASNITMGLEVGLMLLFPLAYRYIWKRKQFLV